MRDCYKCFGRSATDFPIRLATPYSVMHIDSDLGQRQRHTGETTGHGAGDLAPILGVVLKEFTFDPRLESNIGGWLTAILIAIEARTGTPAHRPPGCCYFVVVLVHRSLFAFS